MFDLKVAPIRDFYQMVYPFHYHTTDYTYKECNSYLDWYFEALLSLTGKGTEEMDQ
jgi:hypothetical protein